MSPVSTSYKTILFRLLHVTGLVAIVSLFSPTAWTGNSRQEQQQRARAASAEIDTTDYYHHHHQGSSSGVLSSNSNKHPHPIGHPPLVLFQDHDIDDVENDIDNVDGHGVRMGYLDNEKDPRMKTEASLAVNGNHHESKAQVNVPRLEHYLTLPNGDEEDMTTTMNSFHTTARKLAKKNKSVGMMGKMNYMSGMMMNKQSMMGMKNKKNKAKKPKCIPLIQPPNGMMRGGKMRSGKMSGGKMSGNTKTKKTRIPKAEPREGNTEPAPVPGGIGSWLPDGGGGRGRTRPGVGGGRHLGHQQPGLQHPEEHNGSTPTITATYEMQPVGRRWPDDSTATVTATQVTSQEDGGGIVILGMMMSQKKKSSMMISGSGMGGKMSGRSMGGKMSGGTPAPVSRTSPKICHFQTAWYYCHTLIFGRCASIPRSLSFVQLPKNRPSLLLQPHRRHHRPFPVIFPAMNLYQVAFPVRCVPNYYQFSSRLRFYLVFTHSPTLLFHGSFCRINKRNVNTVKTDAIKYFQ